VTTGLSSARVFALRAGAPVQSSPVTGSPAIR